MTDPETESLRAQYTSICHYELAVSRLRFQTLSLFLAAVGLIIGLSHNSEAVGGLLVMLSAGLWVIDLRSRDLLSRYRSMGRAAEATLLRDRALLFSRRDVGRGTIGILNARWEVSESLVGPQSFQVGVDIIFLAVIGYGVWLLVGRGGWFQALVVAPLLVAALAVTALNRMAERRGGHT